ncbi:MAG: hypothetical protein HY329_05965 [Chloroflexi bacterium]|nr:hypothetical protein [Chloroflexota bacterium]
MARQRGKAHTIRQIAVDTNPLAGPQLDGQVGAPARLEAITVGALDSAKPAYQPTVKDLPADERPRERLLEHGAGVLRSSELIAIILGSGLRGQPVTRVAENLLQRFSGLGGLLRAPISELCQVPGIGSARAAELKAALELGRRISVEQPEERPQIRSPADVAALVQVEMEALEAEQFRVVLLES